jgi:antitoxin ParD1/3/4
MAALFGYSGCGLEKMMVAFRTLTVTVPPEIADALHESVQSGEFASESEALSNAVQTWEKQRALENIRNRIKRSIEDPRPSIPIDEVEAHMERYMAERQ